MPCSSLHINVQCLCCGEMRPRLILENPLRVTEIYKEQLLKTRQYKKTEAILRKNSFKYKYIILAFLVEKCSLDTLITVQP
jgi:hypothetical protein